MDLAQKRVEQLTIKRLKQLRKDIASLQKLGATSEQTNEYLDNIRLAIKIAMETAAEITKKLELANEDK